MSKAFLSKPQSPPVTDFDEMKFVGHTAPTPEKSAHGGEERGADKAALLEAER